MGESKNHWSLLSPHYSVSNQNPQVAHAWPLELGKRMEQVAHSAQRQRTCAPAALVATVPSSQARTGLPSSPCPVPAQGGLRGDGRWLRRWEGLRDLYSVN